MNREIKFRAWDGKQMLTKIMDREMTIEGLVRFGSHIYPSTQYRFMQYTGLKDKNGVEIYEGDILAKGEYKLKVVFHECGFTVQNTDTESAMPASLTYLQAFAGTELTVVGNIYENPTMLHTAPKESE